MRLALANRLGTASNIVGGVEDGATGFLRDVAKPASGSGLVVSDASQSPTSYIQLSDEEILANNQDVALFFEMIEASYSLAVPLA